jgi:membrane protease YdiL (CAAX protease family)
LTGASPPARRQLRLAIFGSIGFTILGIVLFALLSIPFAAQATGGFSMEELARRPTVGLLALQGVGLLVSFGLATWLVGNKLMRLTLGDLRWRTRLGWAKGIGAGLVLGILPAAVAMLLGVIAGGAAWTEDTGSFAQYAERMAVILLLLAPAALAEEVLFRGVPLVLLAGPLGRPAALVVLSVLFALSHITNPDITFQAVGNITLAGILLSLAFYSPGGMWTAFGAHFGWNATLAALGAPVSGLPFEIPLVNYAMGGPSWLTGGTFGPEGGLVSTMTITMAIVMAVRWVRSDPS